MESTTLYFKEGSSDTIYQAAIEQQEAGYLVTFAYGRRGATLSTGTKTSSPVAYEDAQRIYDKLIKEKRAKGYTAGEAAVAYTDGSRKVTDVRPQLLNAVDAADTFLMNDAFFLQEKKDGKRLLIRKQGEDVTGINRRGIECGIPGSIRVAAGSIPHDFLIDGEAVGETHHVFDLLEIDGSDIRHIPYRERLIKLAQLLSHGKKAGIHWITTTSGYHAKSRAFEKLRDERAEGVVFKRISSPYSPGRPSSGGDHLKFKFVETASVVVQAINSKRSVQIGVWDHGKLVPAGNVTIPLDQPIPQVGNISEIRYLYAIGSSGSLYQPVYLGVRDDITAEECTRDQLKFRREPEEVAA